MDNVIAISFADEDTALQALTRLRALDQQSKLAVREARVVERDAEGRLIVSTEVDDREPYGAATGAGGILGGVVGAVGGPGTILAGGALGGLVGGSFDVSRRDEDDTLLAQFSRHVGPGTTAVLAHVDEPDESVVDNAMHALGGAVLRQPTAEVQAELGGP